MSPIWLLIFAILIQALTSALILLIRLFNKQFGYSWLLAAIGALLAWPLVLFARTGMNTQFHLLDWFSIASVDLPITLRLDQLSWSYALILATLILAVILTDVARIQEADWSTWVGGLALTALGIFAVLAGNPLTLLLAWSAIDLVDVIILLWKVNKSDLRERGVIAFSARIGGLLLLLTANLVAISNGQPFDFEAIPANVSILLLLAVGLRLGVLPYHAPFFRQLPLRRGLGTLLRLVPAAASLVLLPRVAVVGIPGAGLGIVLFLTGMAGIYAGFAWLGTVNELDGRPYWIMGFASLALAAAALGKIQAALAWGIACIAVGAVLFLFSARGKLLRWILFIGLLGATALPLTPTWKVWQIYQSPFSPPMLLFPLIHALLILGFIRHTMAKGIDLPGAERWVWVIYPWGLALLPLTHLTIYWLSNPDLSFAVGLQAFIFVVFTLATFVAAGWLLLYREIRIPGKVTRTLQNVFSLHWFYQLLWRIYRGTGWVIYLVGGILEGAGGLMWAWLLLTLLVALLIQMGSGT